MNPGVEFKQRVEEAGAKIKDYVRRTPIDYSYVLSEKSGGKIYFKMESDQVTGSFKIRGAFNKILQLKEASSCKSVVTASSGNHALACMHACSLLGISCTVYVQAGVDAAKLETLKSRGANVVVFGNDGVEAEDKAREMSKEDFPYVSPYNDIDVIYGQGTIGLEIYEKIPDLDYVIVPVGGGGLIAGIAAYLKSVKPSVKVIGCQPKNSKVMYECVKAGKILFEESLSTICDGTAGGVEEGAITFSFCQSVVDEWVIIEEEQIKEAMYFMLKHHHKVVEGAAGLAIATVLQYTEKFKDKKVVLISCGSNVSIQNLHSIINSYFP